MRKCLWCKLKTNNPKFCSLSCAGKSNRSNVIKKDKTKVCLGCGKNFQYKSSPNAIYCSHSCAAKKTNVSRVYKSKPVKTLKPCRSCGKKILTRNAFHYCSRECSYVGSRNKLIKQWIKDPNSTNTKTGLPAAIRLYLIKQSNYRCSKCGWGKVNKITRKSPLEVDHIDGDCYNNVPKNLRVLCPNCHSLTSNYKALNKNSKRKYRKEYNSK